MYDQFHVPDADPKFVYRWCNTDDRAMLRHKANGYELVQGTAPELVPLGGETTSPSTTGNTRRRGADLVLARIPREAHDRNYAERRRELHAQQTGAVDSSIDQINAEIESVMKARGQNVRGLVFKTSADSEFGGKGA